MYKMREFKGRLRGRFLAQPQPLKNDILLILHSNIIAIMHRAPLTNTIFFDPPSLEKISESARIMPRFFFTHVSHVLK